MLSVASLSVQVQVHDHETPSGVAEGVVEFSDEVRGRFEFTSQLTLTRTDEGSLWHRRRLEVLASGYVETDHAHVHEVVLDGETGSEATRHIVKIDQALHMEGRDTGNGLHETIIAAFRQIESVGLAKPVVCTNCDGVKCMACRTREFHDTCQEDCPLCCRAQGIVVLESPYAGDVERNVEYALRAMKDSLSRSESPYASHLLLTQVLDDNDEAERQQSIHASLEAVRSAGLLAVYEDYGISEGMQDAIDVARERGLTIDYRKIALSPEAEGVPVRD